MKNSLYLIFDFDSTFVKLEALDELAGIALFEKDNKGEIIGKIKQLTKLGMEGAISFPESLSQRFEFLSANKSHVEKLIELLRKNVSDSIAKNKKFFLENKENIYIISGGFSEYIYPVAKEFGIEETHILANSFLFDESGNVIGFDKTKNMSQENGKAREVQRLGLFGEVWVVGDGYTDYQIREAGGADKFIAFSENVTRESVFQKADHVVANMDELVKLIKKYKNF